MCTQLYAYGEFVKTLITIVMIIVFVCGYYTMGSITQVLLFMHTCTRRGDETAACGPIIILEGEREGGIEMLGFFTPWSPPPSPIFLVFQHVHPGHN